MRAELDFKVRLEATVALSEDPEKVLAAMLNVLGDAQHTQRVTKEAAVVESSDRRSLDRLHDQLRDRQVRGAARKRFLFGREAGRTTVMLNRQAAAAGVFALCDSEEESPLGPIYLTVESRNLDAVIEWLAAYREG